MFDTGTICVGVRECLDIFGEPTGIGNQYLTEMKGNYDMSIVLNRPTKPDTDHLDALIDDYMVALDEYTDVKSSLYRSHRLRANLISKLKAMLEGHYDRS